MNYVDPDWGLLLGGFVALAIHLVAWLGAHLFLVVITLCATAMIIWPIWRLLEWAGLVKLPTGKPKPAVLVLAGLVVAAVMIAVIPFLHPIMLGLGYVALGLMALTIVALVVSMVVGIGRSMLNSVARK